VKIVLIGAGHVATQLGKALKEKDFQLTQIYSRTLEAAQTLAHSLQIPCTNQLQSVDPNADLYFFAVRDSALPEVLAAFPPLQNRQALWVHTAGSLPMSIFQNSAAVQYGVFYPLQTFSKNREIAFDTIPLFTEANTPRGEQLLEQIAHALSDTVIPLSSDRRKYLHLAAVFACNFTNHLYDIAAQILNDQSIDWKVLLPLMEETAAKVRSLSPREAQTGPAVRSDAPVIKTHLELLKHRPDQQEIYQLLSRHIIGHTLA
jgi:predicted short-subunit dehydrogenase-like oxidoreductase (DUF2520 family)